MPVGIDAGEQPSSLKEGAMKSSARFLNAVVAGALVLAVSVPAAHALSDKERKCQENIAKSGRKFFKKKLKTIQKCNDKLLRDTLYPCAGELPGIIAALEAKLDADLDKKCAELNAFNFQSIGFPGKCADPDPANGFDVADLKLCMRDSHEATVDDLIEIEYGGTTPAVPIMDTALVKCQKEIAKQGGKYADCRLKNVQKCRNYLNKGKLSGFAPKCCAQICAMADPTTAEKIQKCEDKARAGILGKCTGEADELVPQLDVCNPPVTTAADLADCIIQTHADAVDYLIEIEYPDVPPAVCGDNNMNAPGEECDGGDDAACPGQCGAPDGYFSCLCLDIPRQRVIEHANADLDYPWSHDMGVVEGGGYVADLYDCDGPLGPDVICTVGPSCALAPNGPCTQDGDCSGGGDFCRKTHVATGPHCNLDHMVACTSDAQCPGIGNFCVKQYNGLPLPLAAGGISVCVVNEFSEDIVGTTNLATGESAVRVRQWSTTHLEGNNSQPCPVCGNWCNDPVRRNCATNADCDPGVTCVTEPICSRGPNKDKTCRPDPPFGGVSLSFGITSVDCPPNPGNNISVFDILFDPRTTGTVTLTPSVPCTAPEFTGDACIGGPNDGRPCSAGSDCPSGTCSPQCFCPGQRQPNGCEPACVGGLNNAAPCGSDSDCADGFCHPGDCRLNPEDTDSVQEGRCSVPAGRECFVNSGIMRQGSAGVPERTTAGVYCMPPTSGGAVNNTLGLPGPAALTQPETTIEAGL